MFAVKSLFLCVVCPQLFIYFYLFMFSAEIYFDDPKLNNNRGLTLVNMNGLHYTWNSSMTNLKSNLFAFSCVLAYLRSLMLFNQRLFIPAILNISFKVGLEKMATEHTRLIYMTTGVLLQKLVQAKCLTEYSHIFVDEVQKRGRLFAKFFWGCMKLL